MDRDLRRFVVLAVLCTLSAGCSKTQTPAQEFTRDLSPGKIPPPSQLLAKAETAPSADQKLALFEQFVASYPDSPRADFAQFMVGFLLSEELERPKDAAAAFNQLKTRHPASEWIDDADTLMAEMARTASAIVE
ncbi:hypothetical protein JXA88_07315 [Candidatus Fermentibacteria bacterium]|nr:hypothetical protein [Candidatus Fermentibacteria bacterium]